MIILPFILEGQNLQKGENFPEVVERSANYLKMVVDGIPDDYTATAYFNLSWENNGKPYGIPMSGNSCNIDEYITTLPKHPSDYVDYVVSVSLAYFNGEDRRITTNKVDILIDKTAYYPETENTPEIPESQYDAFVNDVAGYAQLASESAKKAQEFAESFPESVFQDETKTYTTIADSHIEIVAGENDDSMIEMSEDGIDIHANGGVSISNVVDPTRDGDAVNKKYVDDKVKNLQPGGGGTDLSEYVKKNDYATKDTAGVVTLDPDGSFGVGWNEQAGLFVSGAGRSEIQRKSTANKPITPYHLDYAIRVGITDNTETLTGEEQAKAQEWLGVTAIVGDIETALDGIIAIQNELLGGEAV